MQDAGPSRVARCFQTELQIPLTPQNFVCYNPNKTPRPDLGRRSCFQLLYDFLYMLSDNANYSACAAVMASSITWVKKNG